MITIPAGAFMMGNNSGPEDERPAHTVELPSFAIDRTPVTNAQFAIFLDAVGPESPEERRFYDVDDEDARIHQEEGRWLADQGFADHPVMEVSWFGARRYCDWAGKRLPTEAEWEKAARGSDGRKYPWGNSPPDSSKAQFDAEYNESAPVDGFPQGASPYGVLDLSGNAWEWVSSIYLPYPYDPSDGREDLRAGPVRGTRGGGHDSPSEELTTTHRGEDLSRNHRGGHHNIGFRCAR
jgi:iron(II)-dependent oxidoreductase